jgi:hypothetical protein
MISDENFILRFGRGTYALLQVPRTSLVLYIGIPISAREMSSVSPTDVFSNSSGEEGEEGEDIGQGAFVHETFIQGPFQSEDD